MKITRDKAKKYIYNTNGKIFSAIFIKKDGEKRRIVCRRGVSKYVTGKGLGFNPATRSLIGVFDMHKKAYRFINTNTLEQITVQGKTYKIKESK